MEENRHSGEKKLEGTGEKETQAPRTMNVEEYKILNSQSSVRISLNAQSGAYFYEAVEPSLNETLSGTLQWIRKKIISGISYFPSERDKRISYVERKIDEIALSGNVKITSAEKEIMMYYLTRELEGYGAVQVPMLDESIEDISCDGPLIPIFVYHKKYGSMKTNISFNDDDTLNGYVAWIVQKAGKHVSIANPMVDCTLPDGSRLQATLGREITKRGASFTIRRFGVSPLTPLDLIGNGTINTEVAVYLWFAVEKGMNVFFVGGTASGKTTTLNSSLLFIPQERKVVSIEDTREIRIPHENWIPLVTRQGHGAIDVVSGKKGGEVNMFDLLVTSLRQRPTYIVVGEVRGREAYTVFQSMATGQTAFGTFHADDITSFVHRLEGEPLRVPRAMMASLDIVVFQEMVRSGGGTRRRITKVLEILGIDRVSGELSTSTVFSWDGSKDKFNFSGTSRIYDKIMKQEGWSSVQMEEEIEKRDKFLRSMLVEERGSYSEFSRKINSYYRGEGGKYGQGNGHLERRKNEEGGI